MKVLKLASAVLMLAAAMSVTQAKTAEITRTYVSGNYMFTCIMVGDAGSVRQLEYCQLTLSPSHGPDHCQRPWPEPLTLPTVGTGNRAMNIISMHFLNRIRFVIPQR